MRQDSDSEDEISGVFEKHDDAADGDEPTSEEPNTTEERVCRCPWGRKVCPLRVLGSAPGVCVCM